jgi:hypothetical protein
MTDNENRYRISTKFTSVKVFVWIGISSMLIWLGVLITRHSLVQGEVIPMVMGMAVCAGLLYFVATRKRIDYDDIRQELYIVDEKMGTEEVVRVAEIHKISLSGFGFDGPTGRSWNIAYTDGQGEWRKFRLYPIPLSNDIETLIIDAKLANPELVVRRWTFGWNEFFD